MTKWAVELSEHDIQYQPRPAIKAQVLADFLLECTIPKDGSVLDTPGQSEPSAPWFLHADGSFGANGSGAGLVLTSPEGVTFEYGICFSFSASNNEAEYEALLFGLRIAHELKVKKLIAYTDSHLVVGQVTGQVQGEFEAQEPNMIWYLRKVRDLSSCFNEFKIVQISRAENARADLLSCLTTTESMDLEHKFYLEVLEKPSIVEADQIMQVDTEPSWMDPLFKYLKEGLLPDDRKEAMKLKMQLSHYVLIDD